MTQSMRTLDTLPLDWTQLSCVDPNCRVRHSRPRGNTSHQDLDSPTTVHHGTAIFCLTEADPEWFQGYFWCPTLSPKPIGIVAVQQPLNECLECEMGGYRVLNLTLQSPKTTISHSQTPITLKDVEWTGGDMVRLDHPQVQVVPCRVRTGTQAVPLVERFFGSLVQQCATPEASSVLEVFPDVSIVQGDLVLVWDLTETGESRKTSHNTRLEETSNDAVNVENTFPS